MTNYTQPDNHKLSIKQAITTFPNNVLAILFFTLITRISYFMVWPFLAIILTQTYQLTPIVIGSLMSGCALFSVVTGIWGGSLSDRLGRKRLLALGCFLAVIGYSSIAIADNILIFSIGLLLTGVSFSWIDGPSRALISDLLNDEYRRELALQVRYFIVNIAAVSGPLIGIIFGLNSQKQTFFITALSYIPFLIFILIFIPSGKLIVKNTLKNSNKDSFLNILSIITHDSVYFITLISGVICYVVYAQIESIVPQYLLIINEKVAINLVTVILITNAISVLISQAYLISLLKNTQLDKRIIIGAFILAISQLLFWTNNTSNAFYWSGVTIVFSIAEAILLPNLSVLLDRLAPESQRGAYLGASTLIFLGLSLGPFIGGSLLDWFGRGVFIVMMLFCLSIIFMMVVNKRKFEIRLDNKL